MRVTHARLPEYDGSKVALAARLGINEKRVRVVLEQELVTSELQGYLGEDELPEYRVIHSPLEVDGIAGNYQVTRQSFPLSAIPEFARERVSEPLELRDGVWGLEALLAQGEIKLMPAGAADLVRFHERREHAAHSAHRVALLGRIARTRPEHRQRRERA